jgi:peptidoglycan/LPS O-acetylase OafA/YrhL
VQVDTIGLTTERASDSVPLTNPPGEAGRGLEAIEGRKARRIDYLDGWRGVSLICVLIGHFAPLAGMQMGALGVELFFVLSGRLMAEILFVETFPLKKFYIRRFSRIFPAMVVFVIAAFFLLMHSSLRFKPAFIVTDLTFTYNYAAVFGHRTKAIDQIWSLCIEEHAYLLLGLLALASRMRKLPVTRLIFGLAVLSMLDGAISDLVLHQDWFSDYWRTDAHLASVLIAAGVYLVTRRRRSFLLSRAPSWLPLACAVGGIALFAEPVAHGVSYTLGTTLLAIAVCTIDAAARGVRAVLANPLLTWAGVLSYSIYLWQQPFYGALELGPSSPVRILAYLTGAILAGAASFYLLEQPARQFLNRMLTGGASRTAALAVARAQ